MQVLWPIINAERAELQQDLSQATSHLLTTVASCSHALNACTHKNIKIRGTQHRLEYYPSSSHKESVRLGSLTGRVQILTKGGTEVHRFLGFLGVGSAKVCSDTTSPQRTQPVTRQSYPPCYMLQSRNIW